MADYDFLIVGSGFAGSVLAEQITSRLNKKVLIVDKRNHVGGNAYDYYNESGILVHKYGPHWFHTNDKNVFTYLSNFTEWRYHYHRVKTYVDGQLLPIPINMDTINELYGMNLQSPNEVQDFYNSLKANIKPTNAEEMVVSQIGEDLYNKFFKGYTLKQWEIHPKDLASSVTARIPTRTNRDDRYFTDTYQCMPKYGYTALFEKMLANPNISILLNTDYREITKLLNFKKVIYTGPIDSYFDYMYGKLPYRSLRFEHETYAYENHQSWQQINYPNDYDFTRIVEWKHATGQVHPYTTVTREYSFLADDKSEKYYPIPREENNTLFNKYKSEADKLDSVIFCGRLADYKYYNMDQVIARALTIFNNQINV
ncbi:UDP-galactopyranose mutase [Dyadobacter diqingensis]|uniref:UDP-galactopyranose mutase n=1 Tax=Dyadobacter diqingensis TaxID=2938121 RepID=UPI0020C1B470|nr:UDP-galactopyranose mutase [Dyadobacter diqingensis]